MTTYEGILSCKPDSILSILPDLGDEPHVTGGRVYEWKYAVAKWLQPRSVLEIGVHVGRSLACFIAASDVIERFEGIDSECYVHDSNRIALERIRKVKDIPGQIWKGDSLTWCELGSEFDLVHIDGSHNYETCLHDLRLCIVNAKWILVDDWDTCEEDRKACSQFIREQQPAEVIHLPSLHGELLIRL